MSEYEHDKVAEKADDQAPSDHSRSNDSDLEDAANVDDKALMRKIDLTLLPGVTLLYLMSFLDRSNVANARIEGLTEDTNMSGNQYLTGLTLFFIGYVLFEIPCKSQPLIEPALAIERLNMARQYHPQAHNAQVLAADAHHCFRHRCDTSRRRAKHGWLLRRAFLSWCG